MPPPNDAANSTRRSVTINVDGQEVKACTGLGMMAVKVNNMDDKLDTIIAKVDALNHAKKDGATSGGIVGFFTAVLAMLGVWLKDRFMDGG
jgi:hypothetical protein